ncbi:unnamed protein product [Meganyctiphanes norvegica]|uniref:Carbohydrate sulfotransferase n=1 Tax=Meganyctiphanes norvegica TaxID=48144 RepID=A0AAV2QZ88_MEGNR
MMRNMKSIGFTWRRLLIICTFLLAFVMLNQNQVLLVPKRSVLKEDESTGVKQDESVDVKQHPKDFKQGESVEYKHHPKGFKQGESVDSKSVDNNHHPNGFKVYGKKVKVALNITWTPSQVSIRKQEYERRKQQLSQGCQELDDHMFHTDANRVHDKSLWNIKDNFIWCPILKAGSTTWMRILAVRGKLRAPKLRSKLRKNYRAPKVDEKKKKVFQNATKFFIVRHPFERLLSAYRDKMLSELVTDDVFRPLQMAIANKYSWDHATNTTSKTNKKAIQYLSKTKMNGTEWIHPTFMQFLLRVQDDMQQLWAAKGDFQINGHWAPYWYSCAPCKIDYDVIARMESIDVDNDFIIHQSHLKHKLNAHSHSTVTDKFKSTSEATKYYFGQTPLWLLKDLVRLYLPDFKLFGYDPQKYLALAQQ